ncbi:polysaccharide deacetylase family protein [Alicycliphilus denitrificans]|uniref:polysaccharide deacetylase family protein n=1 Tax=Alicycliphilus denitrificans TaxID=179636 RepID=UPI00384A92E6
MWHPCLKLLSNGKLTVLSFDKVPVQASPFVRAEFDLHEFEKTLKKITDFFCIMPLIEAVRSLRSGNLPARVACFTFDGGYADWRCGVIPVLEKKAIHATFFVATGQFSGRPMWSERILHVVKNAPAELQDVVLSDPSAPRFGFGDLNARRRALTLLSHFFKHQGLEHREALLEELEGLAGVFINDVPCMSIDDLRAIHAKGFDIGANSVNLPILRCCSLDQARREIGECREHLESLIGHRIAAFSYPNGIPGEDFEAKHVQLVQQCGYELALTRGGGAANGRSSLFQMPRFTPHKSNLFSSGIQFGLNLVKKISQVIEPVGGERRVLMVAFHFPPQSGSSGILRTLNFVKHLPSHQWHPVVLTASSCAYEEQRNDLIASVPSSTPILRAFALDAARHLSIAKRYLGVFALPDRWSTWWFMAVFAGMKAVKEYRPAAIWSTYPIPSAHMIAATISSFAGLPWVADFRDPMVSANVPPAGMRRKVWRRLEAHVLRSAAACIFTTQRAAQEYAERYPEEAHKCQVIANGYDEAVFSGVKPARSGIDRQTLFMLHSGLIYPRDRDPSTFFAAIQSLINDGSLDRDHLHIRFRAPKHGEEVADSAARYGLSDVVDIAPPISYEEAIAEMLGANLLIVFQGPNFNAQIPAKIYEYLRAQSPLLAVLDPAGDTAAQLRSFDGVFMGDIRSSQDVRRALLEWLMELKMHGNHITPRSLEGVRSFSREAQAERLCQLLEAYTQPICGEDCKYGA